MQLLKCHTTVTSYIPLIQLILSTLLKECQSSTNKIIVVPTNQLHYSHYQQQQQNYYHHNSESFMLTKRHLSHHRHRHHLHRHLRHKTSRSLQRIPTSNGFALNCPHVADANNEQVRIEVTWTKDDAIWLKIENGERRIYNKLSSFNRKRIGKKSVLRITLNKGRYIFGYDELTGDFGMEIQPVIPNEDEGVWQCHVTVHQKGDTYTLTSRSRVKNKGKEAAAHHLQMIDGVSPIMQIEASTIEKKHSVLSSFTRPEQSTIEINRDTAERKQTIVFDRPNLPSAPNQRHTSSTGRRMAIVDYEDDIDTDNADGDKATNRDYSISSSSFSGRHNRKRHRHSPNHAFKPNASSSSSLVFIFVAMYISQR